MKKVWLFILVLVIPIGVFARAKTSCDYTLLSKLKRYASNVNIIYDYKIINDEVYFDITISNVVPQIYISDETSGKTYYASGNGEIVISNVHNIKKNTFKIKSNDILCMDELLLTQYVTLPVYNKFSTDPLCDGLDNYNLCYTFIDTDLTYDEFKEKIEAYKKKKPEEEKKEVQKEYIKSDWEKFLDFMIKYGIFIAAAIAILITSISIYRSRKNKFDFKL